MSFHIARPDTGLTAALQHKVDFKTKPQGALGTLVRFRDEIARPLAVDGQPVEVTGAVLNDFGGFAGGLDRRIEHRMHDDSTDNGKSMSRAAAPSSGAITPEASADVNAAESLDFSVSDAAQGPARLLTGSEALSRIAVVLSHTSHPGNIGAAARAMKTMGLSDLRLVNPEEVRLTSEHRPHQVSRSG